MNNKIFLLFLLGVFLFPLVSAVPPFQTGASTTGFEIRTGIADTMKLNQNYDFHVHVFNISNGVPIRTGTTCYLHIYNSTGHHSFEGYDSVASHDFDYGFFVDSGNFTEVGYHPYIVQCNSTNQGGWVAGRFLITTTGNQSGNTLPLFLLLGAFIILAVALSTKNEFFGYFSGLVFAMAGVYMMIYGLGEQWNIYTQTISYISLGLGLILIIVSAYETIWGGEE